MLDTSRRKQTTTTVSIERSARSFVAAKCIADTLYCSRSAPDQTTTIRDNCSRSRKERVSAFDSAIRIAYRPNDGTLGSGIAGEIDDGFDRRPAANDEPAIARRCINLMHLAYVIALGRANTNARIQFVSDSPNVFERGAKCRRTLGRIDQRCTYTGNTCVINDAVTTTTTRLHREFQCRCSRHSRRCRLVADWTLATTDSANETAYGV
jgi:hypothetical protein